MLQRFQSIDANLSNDALDILELFAQTESLTIAQVTNNIKSTKTERVYKNVYYLIQKLRSSNLIEEEANVDKTKRRHNERYFKLTDEGIYQLFRKMRFHGILIDQLSVKKGGAPVAYVRSFLKYYSNNALFELFLYPYIEKQTISADNIGVLSKLFRYLHNCCKQVDAAKISYVVPQFFWNKIPGENNNELLTSLKHIFTLENVDIGNSRIEKSSDNNTISVTAPQVNIVIKLDKARGKTIATVYNIISWF
jgi:DNA-binding PadR family transcriptional regulator